MSFYLFWSCLLLVVLPMSDDLTIDFYIGVYIYIFSFYIPKPFQMLMLRPFNPYSVPVISSIFTANCLSQARKQVIVSSDSDSDSTRHGK